MKTNFVWTESHSRELSRIERYLRFGTEMNAINCPKTSSFNSLIKTSNESKTMPRKTSLKCVNNLWSAVREFDKSVQKSVADRVSAVIGSVPQSEAIVFVIISLYNCQTRTQFQSPFRTLAIELILSPEFGPNQVLVLCCGFGRKQLNSSKHLRETISSFYSKNFDNKSIEHFLAVKSKFDWTHSDVIRLCHVTPNNLTKILMKRKSDKSDLNEIEKRFAIFRSKLSKPHELVKELDNTSLDPELWLRSLNTISHRNSQIWLKLIEKSSGDRVLALIPRLLSKFPNHRTLFDDICQKLKKNSDFRSNLVRFYVLYYLEKNFLKIDSKEITLLSNKVEKLEIVKQVSEPILVVIDPEVKLEDKYLSGVNNMKRKKADLMDQMLNKDFYELLIKSFNCFFRVNQDFEQLNCVSELTQSDSLLFPFSSLSESWRRRVIFITQKQQDVNEWPLKADEKLILFHLNRLDLKDLSFYRENVLIINGFDLRIESIIGHFFKQETQIMDTNE